MRTQLEQTAILSKYQCCFAEFGGVIATKLGTYKQCDMVRELRNFKLARAYMYRIHKYNALPFNVTSGHLVSITRGNLSNVTITITIDGTDYSYTGTGAIAAIITSLTNTLKGAGYSIYTESTSSFTFYSYDPALDDIVVTCTNSIADDDNSTTCTDWTTTTADTRLDTDNCLTRTEICGIANKMCEILDPFCT